MPGSPNERVGVKVGFLLRRYLPGTVAVGFISLIACSLIASALGPAVFDRSDVEPAVELEESASEFEQTLRGEVERNPDDPVAVSSLANVLSANGRLDEAVVWHERSIVLAPERAEFRFRFGRTLEERGQRADAEFQYRRALELEPASAEYGLALAQVLEQDETSPRDEVLAAYRVVVEREPRSYYGEQAVAAIERLQGGSPDARK